MVWEVLLFFSPGLKYTCKRFWFALIQKIKLLPKVKFENIIPCTFSSEIILKQLFAEGEVNIVK